MGEKNLAGNPWRNIALIDEDRTPYGVKQTSNVPHVIIPAGIQLQDESGTPYGVPHVNNKPRVSAMPYLYDIAEGNIADHEAVHRFGHNGNISTAWETLHHVSDLKTWLTSAERLQIASDDVDDDGAPVGDGARTVRIDGMIASYIEASETVTMNGQANVLTDTAFLRVGGADRGDSRCYWLQ